MRSVRGPGPRGFPASAWRILAACQASERVGVLLARLTSRVSPGPPTRPGNTGSVNGRPLAWGPTGPPVHREDYGYEVLVPNPYPTRRSRGQIAVCLAVNPKQCLASRVCRCGHLGLYGASGESAPTKSRSPVRVRACAEPIEDCSSRIPRPQIAVACRRLDPRRLSIGDAVLGTTSLQRSQRRCVVLCVAHWRVAQAGCVVCCFECVDSRRARCERVGWTGYRLARRAAPCKEKRQRQHDDDGHAFSGHSMSLSSRESDAAPTD